MLKAILNNPYRILGVYSNSPKKEQIANKGKIQAFLRVNKSMPFKLDLQGILPDICRTQEQVDYADSELALSAGRIKHAQFWFIRKTPVDEIAFNHLTSGDIESAIEVWQKTSHMSSLQNLFVCSLIKNDYRTAIVKCAIPLYDKYEDDFIHTIDENASVSSGVLKKMIVDALTDDGTDLTSLLRDITEEDWINLIESRKIEPILSQLKSHLEEAKSSRGKDVIDRLNAGNKLKVASKPLLSTLRGIIPKEDTRYQMIADKVAQEILQCSIDYYNDTSDLDAPAKAMPLCEYAVSVAVGTIAKQRCAENYHTIKKAFDNMPPIEVAKEAKEIDDILAMYSKQSRTAKRGLELLKRARVPLISIKEKLGKSNSYYLDTSSLLGSAALSFVVAEVNEAQKEDAPDPFDGLFGNRTSYGLFNPLLATQERRRQKAYKLKKVFHDAWQTILYIDLLDKTEDFKKNRYLPNRKTLYSMIDGLKGFDWPDDNYILKGCAQGISVDKKFFLSDSELFNSCTLKSDYNKYLELFPSGNHVAGANIKIKEIEKRERTIRNWIIIIIVVVALFVIILASTAKGNSREGRSYPSYNSEYYDNRSSYDSRDDESEEEEMQDEEDERDEQGDDYYSDDDGYYSDDNEDYSNEDYSYDEY